MLTARGFWLLFFAVAVLAVGLALHVAVLELLGLAVALWLAWEWLLFAVRCHDLRRRLRLRREVSDDRGPVSALWAGGTFEVRVRVEADEGVWLPHVAVADLVPFDLAFSGGRASWAGPLSADEPARLRYRVRCPGPGVARFEGARLEVADLAGLFYTATFLAAPLSLRVLPPLVEHQARAASARRPTRLPPPGRHRLRRPGTGGELLDLRDYIPGDPPRTIAWKVSARRDRLITREYESEVPLRCTIFLDTTASVRLPSPQGRPLQRLVEIAAGVARGSAAARDLTGLVLFDEAGTRITPPARSQAHLTRLLRVLADAAALPPGDARVPPDALLPLAYAFAEAVYPEQLRPDVNAMPFWATWLAAFPGFWRDRAGLMAYLHRRKGRLAIFLLRDVPLGLAALAVLLACLFPAGDDLFAWAVFLSFFCAPAALAFFLGVTLITFRQRRLARWRKRLAALLSVRYGLLPGGVENLMEDDDAFSLYLQRFLGEHRVPYSLPPYDDQGRYRFAAPGKIDVLARALLRAVAHGRDNELFVLLVDLLELDDRLGPLLAALRVALARHHQAVLICAWPPGLPPPAVERGLSAGAAGLRPAGRHGGLRRRGGADASGAGAAGAAPPGGEAAMSDADVRQADAVRRYLLICLAATLLVVLCLAEKGAVEWSVLPLLIGAVGAVTFWRSAPLWLLISLALVLVLHRLGVSPSGLLRGLRARRGFGASAALELADLGPLDLVLCAATLAYLAAHCRLQSLAVAAFPTPAAERGTAAGAPTLRGPRRRPPEASPPAEAAGVLLTALLGPLAGLAAYLLLASAGPPDDAALRWLGLPPEVLWRAAVLVLTGALGVAIAATLLGYLRRSAATPAECYLYLQDQLWRQTRREQSRLARWLTWLRLRRQRREEKS
jgi:uncharacterized protein (DUF58 family)